jgi:succinoglycan biosynthesis transport protein ExoP
MLYRPVDRKAASDTAHANEIQSTEHDVRWMQRARESRNDRELQFRQLASILHRRIRLILAITGLGMMLAVVVGLMIPPKYTATAQLVVEPPSAGLAVGTATSPTDEAIDTHVTLVGSRNHLKSVVESISPDPKFRARVPNASQPEETATEPASDGLSQSAASKGPAASSASDTAEVRLNELERRLNIWIKALRRSGDATVADLEELERGIRVNQERRSRVISVAFTSADRIKAAALANRIVELYVESQIEQQRAYASAEMARLNKRIAELKYEMERAATSLQRAIQHGLETVQGATRDADGRLRELERHAAASAQLYSSLLRKKKEMSDQQEIVAPGVRILSLASVPEWPSSHNPILFIIPALIVFAMGGSLLAVFLEQLDRGLRSERDINDALGIPCIGLVPRLSGGHGTELQCYLLKEPFSAYTEAIRSVAAALHVAPESRASMVVLISSSLPREGKTTLAVSLAAYAALIGRRVLVIDFDFRHPSIPPMLDGKADKTVADLLLYDCLPEDVIRHVPDLNLDYLPVARCPVDPIALFARDGMPELLCQLRKKYDCILIDSPPLLGATEARLLACLADKILFVVKWGSTKRELAQSALNLLCRLGRSGKKCIDLSVAVVTQVDLKEHGRYGYGDVGEMLVKDRRCCPHSKRAETNLTGLKHSIAVARQRTAGAESVKR